MSRRLPLCGGCGTSFTHKRIDSRIVIAFRDLFGQPVVAYCRACVPTMPIFFGPGRRPLSEVLREIHTSGPNRVALQFNARLGRHVTLDEALTLKGKKPREQRYA